jgi:hypothetical protein
VQRKAGGKSGEAAECWPTFPAQSILRLYNLTPSDLWFKWEAFVYASSSSGASSSKKEETLPFNLANLRELKKEIQASAAHTNNASIQGLKRENGESKVKKLGGRSAIDGMSVALLSLHLVIMLISWLQPRWTALDTAGQERPISSDTLFCKYTIG